MQIIERSQLKVGQVFLVSGTNWLGRQIQWFQENKFNHAGLVVKQGERWFISEEGKVTGIINTPIEEYDAKLSKGYHYMIKELPEALTKQQLDKIDELCALYTNNGWYDFGATFVIGLAKYIWKKITGKKHEWNKDQKKGKKKRFRCSAWAMFVLNEITGMYYDYNDYDPVDIVEEETLKIIYVI